MQDDGGGPLLVPERRAQPRKGAQGAFEASMLSLDAHMEQFDDPSKIATFSERVMVEG